MHLDPFVALAGLFVGFTVGLTGMGGGALMTPLLLLFFNISPTAAVSSDLVAAFFMKPVGSAVHLRRGTVHKELVKWLVLGSVPTAFLGVFVLKALGAGRGAETGIRYALGYALLLAAGSMCVKAFLQLRRWRQERELRQAGVEIPPKPPLRVRPVPTLLIGAVGGLVVGMTSVGSGSLIIVALLLLYPTLRASQLVGTDLVQAVPLVGAAALGHVLYGDFQLGLTASVLLGSLPGVYFGARVSSGGQSRLVRRALVFLLMASGLKLVDVPTSNVGIILVAAVIAGPAIWAMVRVSQGFSWRYQPPAKSLPAVSPTAPTN